ncbi:bifunctional phosphopantothenoylcysteine decarboxylase/phosphopantothenate--cysteine ligase CoaBC [Virgibacillus halophilus]|uniref:bifunctional phosphopantothenoylcysteine decarboxylase/phosphopantothenate--cysteine ligase CoaBC n=1 Tax=Tigheibacillus halophilus TaxID=361280 RepID=UPI00362ACC83
MLQHKNIVLGVSGGIAAYKACALTSKLTQAGANVQVIMTKNATEFVSPLTFQALSRNPVYTDTFDEKDFKKIAHIDVADWADIFVIAPATANILAKMANGIADDMLTTALLATLADIYIAPAMNVNMYSHPAVKHNMQLLADRGCHFIEPGAGYLACGWIGKGRLEEPESIVDAISRHQQKKQIWSGKKVLISAGPTREKIDPVRFFTNRSSGKMGFSLAKEAAQMGAEVTLVAGPVSQETKDKKIRRIDVETAEEMNQAMQREFPIQDIVIKAAAVADYRPKIVYNQKMKKKPGELRIEMERTTDILQQLGEKKENQFLVGFAAETADPLAYGKEKLKKKHLDAIVVNNIAVDGAGFEKDTNIVTYINKNMEETEIPLATKAEVANQILSLIDRDMKDELN